MTLSEFFKRFLLVTHLTQGSPLVAKAHQLADENLVNQVISTALVRSHSPVYRAFAA